MRITSTGLPTRPWRTIREGPDCPSPPAQPRVQPQQGFTKAGGSSEISANDARAQHDGQPPRPAHDAAAKKPTMKWIEPYRGISATASVLIMMYAS
eukprot:COSAG01_NODE_3800_length_5685_cov_4.802542_7_plen_96_part_00